MPSESKNDQEKVPDVNRQGWNVEKVAEESTNKPSDEITREVLRGGEEAKDDANDRDIAGGVDSNDTPQGREEAKKEETRGEVENG